mgnify:CR=1 FL=1
MAGAMRTTLSACFGPPRSVVACMAAHKKSLHIFSCKFRGKLYCNRSYLLEQNHIDVSLPRFGGLDTNDITFIEEAVQGTAPAQRVGRPPEKPFLYEVATPPWDARKRVCWTARPDRGCFV